jgi:hypothetical protein
MEQSERDEVEPLPKVEAVFKTKTGNGWDGWEVLEMDVSEKLGQPTHGQLVIAATKQGFDFSPMLGRSCVLVLSRGRDHRRYFKGIVFRIEHRGECPFGSVAKVDFATAVWAMKHGQDSRIFEGGTVPQILEEVFKEAVTPFGLEIRLNLTRTYPAREYCMQYKESDWNFVQRLMADEGIFFYLDEGGEEDAPETVVFVDSNESCPWIETMEPVKAVKAPSPRIEQDTTWVEVQVVWDESGEPVANLPLVVAPPGGARVMRTTSSEGRVRLDPVDPGTCEARCSFAGLKYSECVEFAGVGESRDVQKPGAGAPPRNGGRPQAIVQVSRRKVRSGDTLESIAKEAGLKWQDLAYFNWGTREPAKINEHLFAEVGCTKRTVDGKNHVFDDGDSPGVILVPRPWRQVGLAAARRHVVRVAPLVPAQTLHLRHHLDHEAVVEHAHRLASADGSHEQNMMATDGAPVEQGAGTAQLAFVACPAHLSLTLDIAEAEGSSSCFEEIACQQLSSSTEQDSEGDADDANSGEALHTAEPPETA